MSNTLTDKLAAALRNMDRLMQPLSTGKHLSLDAKSCIADRRAKAHAALAEYDAAATFTPRIVITMEGGLVQDVCANVPGIKLVVVDYDTEGNEDEACMPVAQLSGGKVIGYEDAIIRTGEADFNPTLVETRFKEAQEFEEREP